MNPKIVTAYVPLQVRHLSRMQYYDHFQVILDAVGRENVHAFLDYPLERCWLSHEPSVPLQPANPVPPDRYASALHNIHSHVVQHNRTTWALAAAAEHPDVDCWIWLDFGVAKQGGWRNNKINAGHIRGFFDDIRATPALDVIPFPGISPPGPVASTGNNWRFCGSTHIWPTKFLPAIDAAYKEELRLWMEINRTMPLDLPIWALVEHNHPSLPFRFYQAEYDASQLTNYPYGALNDPPL